MFTGRTAAKVLFGNHNVALFNLIYEICVNVLHAVGGQVVEAVAAIKSDLASERARLAAYKERIAGLEQAADQRTRSLDAALTAERETSRGLVAQVDTWRDTWARVETIVDEAFGPFPVWPVYDTICAMERGIHDGIRAAQELAAIRDLVAPGNPQGTVVDAVRSMRALASLGAPPTSPTVAPPEVFAGASVEELVVQYLMAVDPGLDPGVARSMVSGPRRAGVAAVLARLKVTLVAPEFLRRIPLYTKHGPGGKGDPGICDAACVKCEAERIIARLTAGVPVTPERK